MEYINMELRKMHENTKHSDHRDFKKLLRYA